MKTRSRKILETVIDSEANKKGRGKGSGAAKVSLGKTRPAKLEAEAEDRFMKTGVEGLDGLFRDGIPKNSSVLIAGGAGSGKTLLSLQILYNAAKAGKKCFYMSFEESEERLRSHMGKFGWVLGENEKNLAIKRFNLFDITRYIDALLAKQSGDLLIDVKPVMFPKGFVPEMIVVDSLTAIASAFYGKGETYRLYIEQLFRFFEEQNVTTFLISETNQDPKVFSPTGVEEFLADGVIVLYSIRRGNVRENGIEVLKMRGAKHEKKVVAMQILDNKGVEIYPEQEVFSVDQ
ncbi:MAG: ATPase domain-containing protein [Candidatus Aenigmatarchaeota archaeon]